MNHHAFEETWHNLSPGWVVLSLAAAGFLLAYWLLHNVFGPLVYDEVYFAHTLWLILSGQAQYVDFYSSHLPTYFTLMAAILPNSGPLDLGFIWTARMIGVLVLAAYLLILFKLERRRAIQLMPLLLVFIILGRMIEIRTDTFGLLLFNGAWAILLSGRSPRNIVAASLLAVGGLSFSARAGIMAIGFAMIIALLLYRRRDLKTFLALVLLATVLAVAGALTWVVNGDYVELLVRSVFLDPAQLFPTVTLGQRLFNPDRAPLVALVVSALFIALAAGRRGIQVEQSAVIAGACVTQLALIAADPSPFAYVYGWSAIPTVVGFALLHELVGTRAKAGVAALGAGLASTLAGLIIAYILVKGHQPPTGSILRLTLDDPIERQELDRLPTEVLVRMMASGERQQLLANQLKIRRAVCERVRGPVLTVFPYHPICLPDAAYHWYEVQWPGAFAGASPEEQAAFAAMFREARPFLFVWSGPGAPQTLSDQATKALKGYRVADGFAIKR